MAHSRPIAGDWGLVIIYGQGDQREWSNEYWYSVSTGSPSSTWNIDSAAEAFYSHISNALTPLLSNNYDTLGCQFYANFGSGTLGTEFYNTIAGTAGDSPIPEFTNAVVRKLTATFGRSGYGRWRFTGVDDSNVNGSYLSPGGLSNYQALAVVLKTAVTDQAITWSPANFSRKTGALEPITNCPVDAQLGTFRRRKYRF